MNDYRDVYELVSNDTGKLREHAASLGIDIKETDLITESKDAMLLYAHLRINGLQRELSTLHNELRDLLGQISYVKEKMHVHNKGSIEPDSSDSTE